MPGDKPLILDPKIHITKQREKKCAGMEKSGLETMQKKVLKDMEYLGMGWRLLLKNKNVNLIIMWP